ncbi:MAG: hypothetical protein NT105_17645 [Verrucomicrobia bacterium]|nr:hypothetical protein [Verrucomicrobiota bacterium]
MQPRRRRSAGSSAGTRASNRAKRYPNRRLLWDGEKMEATNDKEANSYVKRTYREGWTL